MKNKLFQIAAVAVACMGQAAPALAQAPGAAAPSVREGLRLVEVERFGDAGRNFRQLVAQAPSPDNYFYYGYALAKAEKPDSAVLMWTEAATKDPKNPLGHVAAGSIEVLRKNLAGAKAQFDEAKKLSKNRNAEVFYRVGEAYTIYPTKDAGEAISNLTKAAELDKARPEILVTLGDAYLIPNDGSGAATNYERALTLNPNYTKAYIRQGQVYERARSYEAAYKRYMEGMQRDSSYTPGYRYLAELQRKARLQGQAIANYRKYIQRSDRNPEALLRFAGFLIEAGNYQEAAQYVAEAEGKTKSPLFQRLKAYTLFETGDPSGAALALKDFLSTVDTSKVRIIGRDYFYLGKAGLALHEDTARSIAFMKQGIAKDSNLRDDLKALGDSAFMRKQYRAATAFRQAYVESLTKPESNDYFGLGQAAYFGKDYKTADEAFAKVTEVSKGRAPTGIFYRGYVAQGTDPEGKTGKAAQFFGEFLKVTSDTSLIPAKDKPKFAKQRATAYAFLAREAAVKKDYKEADRLVGLSLAEDAANKQALQIQQTLTQVANQAKAPAPKAAPAAKPGKK